MPAGFSENVEKVPKFSRDGEEKNDAREVVIFLYGLVMWAIINLHKLMLYSLVKSQQALAAMVFEPVTSGIVY